MYIIAIILIIGVLIWVVAPDDHKDCTYKNCLKCSKPFYTSPFKGENICKDCSKEFHTIFKTTLNRLIREGKHKLPCYRCNGTGRIKSYICTTCNGNKILPNDAIHQIAHEIAHAEHYSKWCAENQWTETIYPFDEK